MAAALARFLCLNGDAAKASPLPTTDDALPSTTERADVSSRRAEPHDGRVGAGDWSGLLEPLDEDLRAELLKYGDLAQATYDGFDGRHWSPYCGTCLHGLRRLLPALGLAGHGYVATAFVYATCEGKIPRWLHGEAWDGHANWIGYVAVAGAAEARRLRYRDVLVAWRGTIAPNEWAMDMRTRMVPFEVDAGVDRGAKVARGFHSIYTSRNDEIKHGERSAREQVAGELARVVGHFRGRGEAVRVTVTGHSLGGALALLAARDAAAAHPGVPVAAVTFSAPRVGNRAFCEGLASRGVRVLRVVVRHDVVPLVPSVPRVVVDAPVSKALAKLWALTGRPPSWAYVHSGDELRLDVRKSRFLKHAYDVVGFHDLETCLHLLDGHESAAGPFRSGASRDVALVNKTTGMLRGKERIPAWWYGPANKGLVRNTLGRWVVAEREHDDLPVPDDRLPLSELD
ncbi:Phospholipase A1-Igamma1, chloroplastic [Dichanthelium oligosanthes]|uniref:Phospholipase A1-Igamma1, chloroplastic n=1 Tax=Dichanthelium oligosanthes TaxID=888268 RepID=A0A1E5WE68_9POAL|nr:Phospholipase A1-Igamma1, chloroplastic [Dichanthelium oligosanthes]